MSELDDHNEEVRGGNRGIGYFRDTSALMRAAATYTDHCGPL